MSTDARPILEIRGLRKRFHDVEVLRGIDLVVPPQQLVFVIGPSGSGKSTLLRCCNRLEEASAGSIRVDGEETIQESGKKIFELILKTASGQKTKSEALGIGDDEFEPWKIGATM